jgi:hypothetical protein
MDSITMDLVNNPESMFNKIPGLKKCQKAWKSLQYNF